MTDLSRDDEQLFKYVEDKDPANALFAKSQRRTGLPLDYDCSCLLREKLLVYMSSEEIEQVDRAFRFADVAHIGQFRSSGAPYITHPIAVTEICADWHLDVDAIISALLHDVIEDQDVSKQDIEDAFGTTVASLVDGLTKIDRIHFRSKAEQQAESFRKMLLAMSKDVRVILVKLADRLHNMRTLGAVSQEKKNRVAKETMEIYIPIAHRLGLNQLVRELEDLCFRATYPNRYHVFYKAMMAYKGSARHVSDKIYTVLNQHLEQSGIQVEMIRREKSLYGVHRKMKEEKKTFAQVMDIYGFRLLVSTLDECYLTLGHVHRIFKPMPGRFKDFIALPKLNNYQSLHTTLVGPYGVPIELQIRTKKMHQVAEKGVTAYWIDKEQNTHINEIQKQTHRWLGSLLDIQHQTEDSAQFLEHVKVDLFPEEIYVLTPKGRIVTLPRGATVVDFAYNIHTDIGNHAYRALVNHEEAPLNRVLVNGDRVEIICDADAIPSLEWLGFVRSGKSRAEIRHFLRKYHFEQSAHFGYKQLMRAMQDLGLTVPSEEDEIWQEMVRKADAQSVKDLWVDIGLGRRLATVVARRFCKDNYFISENIALLDEQQQIEDEYLFIQGNEGDSVQLSSCCCPIPGDSLLAFVRHGQGVTVHTSACRQAREQAVQGLHQCKVFWDENPASIFVAKLDILINNVTGALAELSGVISDMGANIHHIFMNEQLKGSSQVSVRLTVEVKDLVHLKKLMDAIHSTHTVSQVVRYQGD